MYIREKLVKICKTVGEVFVTKALFHNWESGAEKREEAMKCMVSTDVIEEKDWGENTWMVSEKRRRFVIYLMK